MIELYYGTDDICLSLERRLIIHGERAHGERAHE